MWFLRQDAPTPLATPPEKRRGTAGAFLGAMTNKTLNAMRYALLLVTLGLFAGCSDYLVDSSAESVEVEPRSRSFELPGRTVYLRRRSTLCGSLVSNPLVAQVGAGVEFTSDQTCELEPPCS